MKHFLNKLLLLFLLCHASLVSGQVYDSLFVLEFEHPIQDLEIDEEAGKVYVSSAKHFWSIDLTLKTRQEFKVKAKDLPAHRFYAKNGAENGKLVMNPTPFTETLFTSKGEFLILYRLQHQYEFIYIYRKKRDKYKLYQVFNNGAAINSVAVNNDLIMAVGSGYGQISLWDIKDKKFIRLMEPGISKGAVFYLHFSEDDKYIGLGNGSSEAVLIDYKTDSVCSTWKYGFMPVPGTEGRVGQGVNQIIFLEQQNTVAVQLNNMLHNSLNLWNTFKDSIERISPAIIQPLSLARDNSNLLIATDSDSIFIYDLVKGELTKSFPSDQKGLRKIEISDSGKYLISISGSGTLKVWLRNTTFSDQ
jgi:WD40 repeat protein